jgi:ABC-2 type transport system ATP-binding protein
MASVIQLNHVTKTYGASRGVKNLNLEVEEGQVTGFLGPNGAGKTTTISMLMDLIRPTSGEILVFGMNTRKKGVEIRKRIGFLAGDFALDKDLTGWQQLEYYGNMRGGIDKAYISELAERLECDLSRRFKNLSRGNRQKVGLISALMHRPELLIFDEPTSGLDPLMQAEFNKIIAEHKAAGKTAFISSHVLSEVEALCDNVAFIREGEIIANRTMQELNDASTRYLRVTTEDKKLLDQLAKLRGTKLQNTTNEYSEFTSTGNINDVLALLAKHKVQNVTISEADLESIFMHYYQEEDNV